LLNALSFFDLIHCQTVHLAPDSFYNQNFFLAGFSCVILIPECTLRVHSGMRSRNFDFPEELILGGARIDSFFERFFSQFLCRMQFDSFNNQISFFV